MAAVTSTGCSVLPTGTRPPAASSRTRTSSCTWRPLRWLRSSAPAPAGPRLLPGHGAGKPSHHNTGFSSTPPFPEPAVLTFAGHWWVVAGRCPSSALAVMEQPGWNLELQDKPQHAEAKGGLPVLTQGLAAAAETFPSNRISSAPLEEPVLMPEAPCPRAVLVLWLGPHLSSVFF